MTADTNKLTIKTITEAFSADFSNLEINTVMTYFSDQAIYRAHDGRVHIGRNAIRKSFQRLFKGAFGSITFNLSEQVIDEQARTAAILWSCQHKLGSVPELNGVDRFIYSTLRLFKSHQFYWEGVDFFSFDEQYKISSKQTFAKSKFPLFIRGTMSATTSTWQQPDKGIKIR